MRTSTHLEKHRAEGPKGEMNGCFVIELSKGVRALIICSNGSGCKESGVEPWEHVSVHVRDYNWGGMKFRTPTWDQMCQIKDLFFKEDEVVMQLHPAKENYVNAHPHVLHLWRPLGREIPTPPKVMV